VPAAKRAPADDQQHIRAVERRHHQPRGVGDAGIAPGGVGDGRDVELDLGQASMLPGDRHLPAGQADMRPDDDEPVSAGMAGGPDVRRPQRTTRIQPSQGLHKRRPAAVQEGLACPFCIKQPEDDDIQIGVLHSVHNDEDTAGHAGEDLGHPLRPAHADVVKGDAQDAARLHHAATFLGDEIAKVRGAVSEGGIACELGLTDREHVRAHPGPVHIAGGEPAGLDVRRHHQDAVEASTGDLAAHGVQPTHLGDDVTA
jgi:hypothetical protein